MEPKTPINYDELVDNLMTQVRQVTQSVPGFTYSVKGRRRKITTSASAPDEFLEIVAVACDTAPTLAAAEGLTSAEVRDCTAKARALIILANEMQMVVRGILDTVAECRNDVSKRARRFYKHAKSFDHPEERELLVPQVANMQRALGRGRPRHADTPAKPGTPAPPVAPAPTAPTTPTTPTPPKTGGGGAA